KYICYLVQTETDINKFAQVYFEENLSTAYDWLNRFLSYINDSRDDIKAFLTRYSIIPTQQDGIFKPYVESLHREDNPKYFDDDLKTIAKEHGSYNPKEYLVDNKITVADFRITDVSFVTKHIDKLF